ncbi:MAG: hypothetical protein Q9209_004649 [Squamulea sp. 1 TL-2023]
MMVCIVSYRALFTENGKNRRATKSLAAIPLKQIERGNEHSYPNSKGFNGEKPSELGQDNSWSMQDVEGAEALPRDMIGVRSEFLDFAAIPTWHTGFITTLNLIPKHSITQNAKDGELEGGHANTLGRNIQKRTPQEGDTITGLMGGVHFTASVVESSPTALTWTGPPFYHLFRGIHTFRFTPSKTTAGATTFEQEESFSGLFAWAMREDGMPGMMLGVGRMVRGYFEEFNADLKRAVEKGAEEKAKEATDEV